MFGKIKHYFNTKPITAKLFENKSLKVCKVPDHNLADKEENHLAPASLISLIFARKRRSYVPFLSFSHENDD